MLRLLSRITFLGLLAVPHGLAQAAPPAHASPAASSASPATIPDLLKQADGFYQKGNFDAALQKYQELIQQNPKSPEAYSGLTRVYLKQKNVQQAFETVSMGLQMADSAPVRVALGEVDFRQGKISEAEREWANVINSGHPDARAYLGIARVSYAISMYKRAKTMIDQAYQLDPDDSDVRRYWIATLRGPDRIKFLQDYLSRQTSDDGRTRERMQRQLDYLLARASGPKRNCRLVSHTTSTETDLARLLRDPTHLRGYGLPVLVNGEKAKLMLDTGAGGILIDRRVADKAGLTQITEAKIGGIGDKGERNAYTALAGSLKIGELEFHDCPVEVLDKRSVLDDDGLIGGDVFDEFLVDINFPKEKLRLTELPKRPEDTGGNIGLRADNDSESSAENPHETNAPAAAKAVPVVSGPQDRYIAPEMKSYTRVFRFGHMLLVPTAVGEASSKLFILDTGAFANTISPEAAREVTKVHDNSHLTVRGLSGAVKNVYTADKAVLTFGNLRQPNMDIVTFDLSNISDNLGTEISGALGFDTLHLLDIKIDYRDGLVDFAYKANQ